MHPRLDTLGPAFVHLLLEVHPLVYKGVLDYDADKQHATATETFDRLKGILGKPEDMERLVRAQAAGEVYPEDDGMGPVDARLMKLEELPNLDLFRPRIWWPDLQATYSMVEATKILAAEDRAWSQGQYVFRNIEALEKFIRVQFYPEQLPEMIEMDWRYVLLADRPLSEETERQTLQAMENMGPDELWKFFFKAFREIPELGHELADLMENSSTAFRSSLMGKSPIFMLFDRGATSSDLQKIVRTMPIDRVYDVMKLVDQKNFLPDDLRDHWRAMPDRLQDIFVSAMRFSGIMPERWRAQSWVTDPSESELVLRHAQKISPRLRRNPSSFFARKNCTERDRDAAMMIDAGYSSFIEEPTPLQIRLALEQPIPVHGHQVEPDSPIRRWRSLLSMNTVVSAVAGDPNKICSLTDDDPVLAAAAQAAFRALDEKTGLVAQAAQKILEHLPVTTPHAVERIMRVCPSWASSPVAFPERVPFLQDGKSWARWAEDILDAPTPVATLLTHKPKGVHVSRELLARILDRCPQDFALLTEDMRTSSMAIRAIEAAARLNPTLTLEAMGISTTDPQVLARAIEVNPLHATVVKSVYGDNPLPVEVVGRAAIMHPHDVVAPLGFPDVKTMLTSLFGPGMADFAISAPAEWSDEFRAERVLTMWREQNDRALKEQKPTKIDGAPSAFDSFVEWFDLKRVGATAATIGVVLAAGVAFNSSSVDGVSWTEGVKHHAGIALQKATDVVAPSLGIERSLNDVASQLRLLESLQESQRAEAARRLQFLAPIVKKYADDDPVAMYEIASSLKNDAIRQAVDRIIDGSFSEWLKTAKVQSPVVPAPVAMGFSKHKFLKVGSFL